PDLGLEVRVRLRPAHPRSRDGSLLRGATPGARRDPADVRAVPRRLRADQERTAEPLAERARRACRARARRRRRRALLGARRVDGLRSPPRLGVAGFLVNLIHLIPVGILHGGPLWPADPGARNTVSPPPGP